MRDGGRIYCGTKVKSIEDGEPCTVTTADGHTILAESVVVATNSPVNDWMVMHTKQAPYRTFVVAARIPSTSMPAILFWDTLDPYHYIRTQPVEWLTICSRRPLRSATNWVTTPTKSSGMSIDIRSTGSYVRPSTTRVST